MRTTPVPILGAPIPGLLIPSRLNELQKLRIRYGENVNREGRNQHLLFVKFIIPTEFRIASTLPERRGTCRNFHLPRRGCWRGVGRNRPSGLVFKRQVVPQVGESFGMHQPVLDRHIEKSSVHQKWRVFALETR